MYSKRWPTCPLCRTPQKPWYLEETNQRKIVGASFLVLYIYFRFISTDL